MSARPLPVRPHLRPKVETKLPPLPRHLDFAVAYERLSGGERSCGWRWGPRTTLPLDEAEAFPVEGNA